MSYKETANEQRVAAELCIQYRLYKAAASRFYYSLFILAKGILVQNYDLYLKFLEEYPGLTKSQRKRRNFPHDTIHMAITFCLQCNGKLLEEEIDELHDWWKFIYHLRIVADYSENLISPFQIDKGVQYFKELWEVLCNEII